MKIAVGCPPHPNFNETKRTRKLPAICEVQVRQLIQVMERLKIPCFSQSRESLVVSEQLSDSD